MLRFADLSVTPPGGKYPYTQLPETGFRFAEIDFESLLRVVKDHRKANSIPIGSNFRAEIEDASAREILQLFPNYEGVIDETGTRAISKGRGIDLSDIRSFLNVMSGWLAKGLQFVDQSEAERRADICVRCPMNVDIPACFGCSGVTATVAAIKGNHSTSKDDRLRVCGACKCNLQTKVFFPKDVLKRDGVEYPSNCWLSE
jgi:hypothetical protein